LNVCDFSVSYYFKWAPFNSLKRGNNIRLGHIWEDNTKLDPKEIGWDGVDWIHLVQVRDQRLPVGNTVMKFGIA
jgi:hypothetical protein